MKIAYVEIEGFRGFRDKARFDFPAGFVVLRGRNGSGKSTVLDAIDFALTGTINKFSVKNARGGGLDEHIWWLGEPPAAAYYVSIGFVTDDGATFTIKRDRERGCDTSPEEIASRLSRRSPAVQTSVVMQTSLIRDESIAALSLDLPGEARFTAVRAAIGGLIGPDYTDRTRAILDAAKVVENRQVASDKDLRGEIGRVLANTTEARSVAERSAGISAALRDIELLLPNLPSELVEKTEAVRRAIAERRVAQHELEGARVALEALMPELGFFRSSAGSAAIESARNAVQIALQNKIRADEHLKSASEVNAAERSTDALLTSWATLLDSGHALGLRDGHCPLCNAERSETEFGSAVASLRRSLSDRVARLSNLAEALRAAATGVKEAEDTLASARAQYEAVERRRSATQERLLEVQRIFSQQGLDIAIDQPQRVLEILNSEHAPILVRLERALAVLESSSAVDRVRTLEGRLSSLRERSDRDATRLAAAQRAVEIAKQIDTAARTMANQILTEQFDTVMPLLKELYRRLRPHVDWSEIESDFGGKVRGSLNFMVGDGYNPQFLFSSGQRRAAGLAFLISVHLSRPWCVWRSLLLDDPVQHVDDYRALNLVEVLTAIRKTGRQVVVAVEDSALASLLCRRLRSATAERGHYFELRTSSSGSAEVAVSQEIFPLPRLVLQAS
jgi:chromosome segregation protein